MPEAKQNEDCETYRELSQSKGEVSPRLQAFRDRLRRTFGVSAAPVEAPATHAATESLEVPSFRSVVSSVSSSRSHSPPTPTPTPTPSVRADQSHLVPPLPLRSLSAVPASAANDSSLPDPSLLEA
jgi:hypothetical protein